MELHPVERAALERGSQCEWIAKHERSREYGRLMHASLTQGGDHIIRNWYLARIESAHRVEPGSREWTRLGSIYQAVRDDLEFLGQVAALEEDEVALDEIGNWYVLAASLASIAAGRLDAANRRIDSLQTQRAVLLGLVALAVVARFV